MKRIIPFIISVLSFSALFAQITLTDSYFPVAGDTLYTFNDLMPGIDVPTSGADQVWDFTNLSGPVVLQSVLSPASEGQNASQFPGATILADFQGGEGYYTADNNTYSFQGYVGADPGGVGIEIIALFSPNVIERRANLQYLDVNSGESNALLPFSWDDVPSELTDSLNLPITPDSLRIRVNIDRLEVIDGWGTLEIPGGSYEVLKENRREITDTRLEAKISILPWQDLTDIIPADIGFFGLDTTRSYNFYANDIKEPIAQVTLDDAESEVRRVSFKANDFTIPVKDISTLSADVIAYPNPAIEEVKFELSSLPTGAYKLQIFNILGVPVWSRDFSTGGTKTMKADLSALRKGTYLYSLIDGKGKTLTTKRLMIIRP